jgi:hypothetical protein
VTITRMSAPQGTSNEIHEEGKGEKNDHPKPEPSHRGTISSIKIVHQSHR